MGPRKVSPPTKPTESQSPRPYPEGSGATKASKSPYPPGCGASHPRRVRFGTTHAGCVVEQLWPGINIELATVQLERLIHGASNLPIDRRPQVLGATLIPDDEALFTWCATPSIESVRELFETSGIHFDRVLPVVHAKVARKAPAWKHSNRRRHVSA